VEVSGSADSPQLVVALSQTEAEAFTHHTVKNNFGFLKIPVSASVRAKPHRWTNIADPPAGRSAIAAWYQAEHVDLASSEAELPVRRPAATQPALGGLLRTMGGLDRLWKGEPDDDEEDEDESDDEVPNYLTPGVGSRPGRPGGASSSAAVPAVLAEGRRTTARPEPAVAPQDLIGEMMREGADPGMLPMVMVMQMMQETRREIADLRKGGSSKKAQKKKQLGVQVEAGDTDSGEEPALGSSNGLRAVTELQQMQKRILTKSSRIVREFELDAAKRLGIVEGQAWTLRDWLKTFRFGRYRGMYRCCQMDIQAYEMLRRGDTAAGTAQLVQNLKSKVQMVGQDGDWTAAWLLTGLADPYEEDQGGGTKSEMATIAGYLKEMAKLKKLMKETTGDQKTGEKKEE